MLSKCSPYMGFIYRLTSPSEKSYIGQTIRTIEERFKEHQYSNSGCVAISNAIQKYGWENMIKEWYEVPDDDLDFYEEMIVALLGTLVPRGYNLKDGGGATGKMSEESRQKMSESQKGEKNHFYGKAHAEETKIKIGKANAGKVHTEETKQKMSEMRLGKSHTNETKQQISNSHIGLKHSEETKQKMSAARKGEKSNWYGKTHTEETKQKMKTAQLGDKHPKSKKVYQYTLYGDFIQSFSCSEEAARYLNIKSGTRIRKCARGKTNHAYGFKWSYIEL